MPLIQKNEMAELLAAQDGACLSLFMPLQPGPDKAKNNRILLKNLHKSLKARLNNESDLVESEADLLAPVEMLLKDGRIPTNSTGLAIFAKEDGAQTHILPEKFRERVIVDKQFYIKPLLPLLAKDREIFMLTLSQNQVQLFRSGQDSIERVTPDGLPESIEEALALDDPEKRQQYHTSTDSPKATGEQPAAFHTHDPEEEKKSRLRRFFQQIDGIVAQYLGKTDATPLVIAGVDYLLPIYRKANTYSHLLDEEIVGNVEHLESHELLQRLQPIIEAQAFQEQQADLEEYEQLDGGAYVSTDPAEIVAAAYYGRIKTLFTARNKEIWGTFDPQTGQINETDPDRGQELTNLASRNTLLNRGAVHLLPEEAMPKGASLAAIFRYTTNSDS